MATLFTFLGRGRDEKKSEGYRSAQYRFPDGHMEQTKYFGLALARWLDAERVVILGTPSSMWDVLVEDMVTDSEAEGARLDLLEAVPKGRVDDVLLDRVAPLVERATGRPVSLAVIPHGRDDGEQQGILEAMSQRIPREKPRRIAIDVTHGYRHLAMLGLTAARFLHTTHAVEVTGLYYGALDMTTEDITPVLRLDGLDLIQAWVEGFARYEASGDYEVFAPLLAHDGLEQELAGKLSRAFHFERIHNISRAATELRPVLSALASPLCGASEFFRERLRRSLRWAEARDIAEQQRLLSLQALDRGDALRTTILGLESFISRETLAVGRDPLDFSDRKFVRDAFIAQIKDKQHPKWKKDAFQLLDNIRNALAHATEPPRDHHKQLMKNPERLSRELRSTLSRIATD